MCLTNNHPDKKGRPALTLLSLRYRASNLQAVSQPQLWIKMHTSQISISAYTPKCTHKHTLQGELTLRDAPTQAHTRLSHLPTFSSSISQFLSSVLLSRPSHLQAIATVTLCDITAWWKNECVCLLNTEAGDVTPCASDHDCSYVKVERLQQESTQAFKLNFLLLD